MALQSLFGWAHHADRIPIDPAWRLGQLVRIRRVRVWQPHWLTEPQMAALLATAAGDDLTSRRDRSLLMLGLFAGLRTGELRRLQWTHVSADCSTMEVVGKADYPATAVAPPQLQTQLNGWRRVMSAFDGFDATWPVVPVLSAPNGDRASLVFGLPPRSLSMEGVRQVVNRHRNAIGVAYLRPHDLRRAFAGTLDAHGVPLQDIRVALRHQTLTDTHGYLADNPLRVHHRRRDFTIDLSLR